MVRRIQGVQDKKELAAISDIWKTLGKLPKDVQQRIMNYLNYRVDQVNDDEE